MRTSPSGAGALDRMTAPAAAKSRFLPGGFDPAAPVALLAGRGLYPQLTAEAIQASGVPLRLISFEGETEKPLIARFSPDHHASVKVGQIGRLLKTLSRFEVRYVIMAGQITPGRLFRGLHPDLRALSLLASLKEKNADTIFGAIVREIEGLGIQVLDARSFLDNHLAAGGMMTKGSPPDQDALAHGIRIAKEVARLDIGQGVVVRKGTVLLVEGFDGTNAMLRRAGGFKADDMIFVKTVKPDHDYRFDVPVFGTRTLEVMHEAGIRAAAVEAGQTLILNKPEVIRQANSWRIGIFGYEPPVT